MRLFVTIVLGLAVFAGAVGARDGKKPSAAADRYGIAVDAKTYPQATAKEAFASVLKAVDAKRIDYLLAQLSDPEFVDERVQRLYGGKFDQQVADTRAKLDAATVKQLHRFQDKGEWSVEDGKAILTLKDVPERVVMMKKLGSRWHLENQNTPDRQRRD